MANNIRRYPDPSRARVPGLRTTYPYLQQQPSGLGKIRDYFYWSIINVCIGLFIAGPIPGLLALVFSYLTYKYKRDNNLNEARTWSKRTLVCNILTTVLGVLGICLIIAIVVGVSVSASSSSSKISSSSSNSWTYGRKNSHLVYRFSHFT